MKNIKKSKLNFAIMCYGDYFADWQAKTITHLLGLDDVNLSLLIIDDRKCNSNELDKSNIFYYFKEKDLKDAINKSIFSLYERHTKQNSSSCSSVDLSKKIEVAERLNINMDKGDSSKYFPKDDLSKIKNYDLDFILHFAFEDIKGSILDVPNFGIWSFHHGDIRHYKGGPEAFWEIYYDEPVTGSVLQKLTNNYHGDIILKKGFFSTISNSWSKNLDQVFYGSAIWPSQVAIDILQGNIDYFKRSRSKIDPTIYNTPNPYQLLLLIFKCFYSNFKLPKINQWTIGFSEKSIDYFVKNKDDRDITWLPIQGRSNFIADPFPIELDGEQYIFAENFSYKEEKGKISYVKLNEDNTKFNFKTAIERPFHMSYPYMFKHDGSVYCIPETFQAKEIKLFEIIEPDKWKEVSTLISNIAAVDPTLVNYNGLWWLFFTKEDQRPDTDLYLYYSSNLLGPWTPHKNNPIKTNVLSARPGGTPWTEKGILYRPSQNSSQGYGSSIVINKVKKITPDIYEEEKITEIVADKDSHLPCGRHTLSSNGNITVIDGYRKIWNRYFIRKIYNKIFS